MARQRMRLWSLLLAFVLFAVAGIGNAGIARAQEDLGTVYVSVSLDDSYIVSSGEDSGTAMAYVPIPLDQVEAIYNLATWNDGRYAEYIKRDESGQPVDSVTLLQVFLYMLDRYYSGKTNELNITGAPTSLYFQSGFFGFGENLNYYVNGEYPLMNEGWGATADWIEMSDGDFVDVGMYTDWYFWTDPKAGFHYFLNGDRAIEHEFVAEVGQPLTVGLGRAWGDLSIGGNTLLQDEPDYEFFYGKTAFDDATAESAVFDENAQAQLVFDEPGEYYLWAYGGASDDSGAIVNTPAYAKIVVEGLAAPEEPVDPAETVTETVTAEPVTETVTVEPSTVTVTADPVTQTATETETVVATVTAEPVTETSTATVTAEPVTQTVTPEAVTETETATSTVRETVTQEPVTLTSTETSTVNNTVTAEPVTQTSTATVTAEPVTETVTAEPVTETETATSTVRETVTEDPVVLTTTERETVVADPETVTVTAEPETITSTVTAEPTTLTVTAEPVTETTTLTSTAAPVTETVTAEPVTQTVTATPETTVVTVTEEPETVTVTPETVTVSAEPVTQTSTVVSTVEAEPVTSTVTVEAEPQTSVATVTQEPLTTTVTAKPEPVTTTVTEVVNEAGQILLNETVVVNHGSLLRTWCDIIAAVVGAVGMLGGLLNVFLHEIATAFNKLFKR